VSVVVFFFHQKSSSSNYKLCFNVTVVITESKWIDLKKHFKKFDIGSGFALILNNFFFIQFVGIEIESKKSVVISIKIVRIQN
jgi:hypothetical protein